jgi:hypothetical protein
VTARSWGGLSRTLCGMVTVVGLFRVLRPGPGPNPVYEKGPNLVGAKLSQVDW